MKRTLMSALLLSLALFPAHSQDLENYFQSDSTAGALDASTFRGTRLGTTNSIEITPEGELHLIIQHRFGDITNGLYDLFGIDLATMRLGFDYGLAKNISVSVGRSTAFKMYDLGVRWALLRQDEKNPVSLTAGGSVMTSTLRNYYPTGNDGIADRSHYAAELIIGHRFGNISVQAGQVYLYRAFNILTATSDDYTATIAGIRLKLTQRIDFTSDYRVSWSDNSVSSYNAWSAGIDLDTGGHLFQLYFSNSTGLNQFLAPSMATGLPPDGSIFFGFNLVRVFYP